ncbi:hypothetical protein [Celeribacter sp.]|uniref:hypothetical protein n=1 Tax=Celeribacter sp. TaxID=1890673 RepID=UPI003A9452E6
MKAPKDKLFGLLLREEGFVEDRDKTPAALKLRRSREMIARHLGQVGKSGNLDLIVATEKAILQNDLDRYANSAAMKTSLTTALTELATTERHIEIVNDPAAYRLIDESHSLPKNRKGGLPRDEARQFFASHAARLLNQDKSRLDPEEKRIIDLRKQNMRIAEKLYAVRQSKTLGIDPERAKRRGKSGTFGLEI